MLLTQLGAAQGLRTARIEITAQSIRIDGTEIRTDTDGYISRRRIERLLGKPQDVYTAGLGVTVYSWRDLGIHLQRGWRGEEKGKLFKFQVFLTDYYDKNEDKHSGYFTGHLTVEGVDITRDSSLASVRSALETAGFTIPQDHGVIESTKAKINIIVSDDSKKLERIEAWCL